MDTLSDIFYRISQQKNGGEVIVSVEIDGIPDETYFYRKLYSLVEKFPQLQNIPIEKKNFLKSSYHWQKTQLNIRNHFIHIKKKRFDKRNFRRWINNLLKTQFAPDIPEWKCYFITYQNSKKSFFIWKCNHIYGDGFLVSQYLKHFADNSSITYPKKKRPRPPIQKRIYSFFKTLISLIYFIFFYQKQDLSIDKPDAENDNPLFYHCKTWNLNEIKKIKNYYNVTVNDLLYTILVKALQKYCKKKISISSMSIFNLRDYIKDENKQNIPPNQFGFMILMNNIYNETPAKLLEKNHQKFSHQKSSPLIYVIIQFLHIIYSIAPTFVVKIIKKLGHKSTFGLSNFQTFSTRNYVQGFPVINISNMVIPYAVGSLFTIVSYDDKITLNITYRKRNLTHPKKFIKCLEEVYKEISKPLEN